MPKRPIRFVDYAIATQSTIKRQAKEAKNILSKYETKNEEKSDFYVSKYTNLAISIINV